MAPSFVCHEECCEHVCVLIAESLLSILLASFRVTPELLAHIGLGCARGLPLTDEQVELCLG